VPPLTVISGSANARRNLLLLLGGATLKPFGSGLGDFRLGKLCGFFSIIHLAFSIHYQFLSRRD